MGWRGSHHDDPDRYALLVANQVLGGGMSSRLFQEVREERGLAYTVFSSPSSYSDAGAVIALRRHRAAPAGRAARGHRRRDRPAWPNGITEEEHEVALGYLEGSMLLGLEDTGSRMARLGSGEISRDEVISIDEHLARIRAVTVDDVHRVLQPVLAAPSVRRGRRAVRRRRRRRASETSRPSPPADGT